MVTLSVCRRLRTRIVLGMVGVKDSMVDKDRTHGSDEWTNAPGARQN